MLNVDVLLYIFEACQESGETGSLLAAALVCRRWAAPAQAALCNMIDLTIYIRDSRNIRAERFARTMQTCPHLLSSIRHLDLEVQDPSLLSEHLSWLQKIPPGGLKSLWLRWEYGGWPPTESESMQCAVIRAPGVRGVRSLSLAGRFYPEVLREVAEFPLLENITTRITRCAQFSAPVLRTFPRLKWACVRADVYAQTHVQLLFPVASSPQLQTLIIVFNVEDCVHLLPSALRSVAPSLRHLRLIIIDDALDRVGKHSFMDEVIQCLPSLKRLAITPGTYSSALFERLPRSLKYLELLPGSGGFPYRDALVAYITRAAKSKLPLKMVAVPASLKRATVDAVISEACEACGVALRVARIRW
ncbi:hypothetical protein BD311DRAFT_867197 [Dichomitus squalens]|uniref:F-box domain-containing protein n=1 Tax=Dichomitus squalens TaxID=114155 RepID=A0A4Q9MIQ4_9APHY|nr:hypothetical protein BD311DRAFT_867197 [Dichomitus squalens]